MFKALFSALLLSACLFSPTSFAHGDEKHSENALTKNLGSEFTPTAESEFDQSIEIKVVDGWLAEGPAVIRMQRGQRLQLRITSNADDELHLHGYDISLPLVANQTATLELSLKYAGRFSYELHQAHREIGALEVMP